MGTLRGCDVPSVATKRRESSQSPRRPGGDDTATSKLLGLWASVHYVRTERTRGVGAETQRKNRALRARETPARRRGGIRRWHDSGPGIAQLLEEIEAIVANHAGPIRSDQIGRLVLDGLRELDEVSYLRFASVYKGFQVAGDFEREMAALEDSSPT